MNTSNTSNELKLTRGERNKNPGNIDQSPNRWQGKVANPTDSRFEQFTDVKWGIRALAKLLISYHSRGHDTIIEMINRYAPSSENNSESYITAVSIATGVAPTVSYPIRELDSLVSLVTAVIHHENGRVIYSAQEIKDSVSLAL